MSSSNDVWGSQPSSCLAFDGSPTNVWFDDVAVSQTPADFPIADGSVHGTTPVASGTHVGPGNFRYCTGGACGTPPTVPASPESTTWPLIDDFAIYLPTWVSQATANASAWLEWKLGTLPAETVVPPEAV